ncbi:hypothetical protein T484DRAFT_1840207 [Baffinella frigidus]|nr:hypothetical protein T484DRAFT_1840207 [Cryptophyta sp. CCMP2293]
MGVRNKWGFRKTLVGSANLGAGLFGISLAAASQTLVVGSPGYAVSFSPLSNKLTDAGAVFVFRRNGGVAADFREFPQWTEAQILTQTRASSVESGVVTRLGASVALDEEAGVVLAGMPAIP